MTMSLAPNLHGNDLETSRQTSLIIVGQASVRVCQILIVLILVRVLALETWNLVALMFTIHLVAVTIGSFNLEHSILYFLPTLKTNEKDDLLSRSIVALAIVGCVMGTLTFVFANHFSLFDQSSIGFFLGIAIAMELPTVVAGPMLISQQRIRDAAKWDIAMSFLQVLFVVIPAIVKSDPGLIALGFAVSSIVRFSVFLVVFGETIVRRTPDFDITLLKRQLYFCAPLGVAMATGILTRTVDKWIVAWKFPENLGVYIVASQEVPVLSVLPYASGAIVAGAMVYNFSIGDVNKSFHLWKEQVHRMCFPVVALTFAVIAVAPEAFYFLFDISHTDAVICFQIFSLVGLHRVTEYGAILRAIGKTNEVVLSSAILLTLNTVFAITGAFFSGIIGLTIGSLVAFAASWIWMLWRLCRVFHVNMLEVFPWVHWLKCITVCGLPTFFGMWLTNDQNKSLTTAISKSVLILSALVGMKFVQRRNMNQQIESLSRDNEYTV